MYVEFVGKYHGIIKKANKVLAHWNNGRVFIHGLGELGSIQRLKNGIWYLLA